MPEPHSPKPSHNQPTHNHQQHGGQHQQQSQKQPPLSPAPAPVKSSSKSSGGSRLKGDSRPATAATAAPLTLNRTAESVDAELDRWPYCIVWTPLPVVTWFVPIIGHTGVANSKGVIYDFSDDFNVSIDNFSFGRPTKYYQFHSDQIPNGAQAWDKAIQETSDYYSKTRHSLFFNNCHQYIAGVLNKVKYSGRSDWTQTGVWWKITFRSRYTDFLGFARQWIPFTIILIGFIVLLSVIF